MEEIQMKKYVTPELRYLRVQVIEAQELKFSDADSSREAEYFVRAIVGTQQLRTKPCAERFSNLLWNDDFMFVVEVPVEVDLLLSVEQRGVEDKVVASCVVSLKDLDNPRKDMRWYKLETTSVRGKTTFSPRIHIRIHWEYGYADIDGCTRDSGDSSPNPVIGVLEVRILDAIGLSPMKTKHGRATVDAYCVAKYRNKWVRTSTIVDSFNPRWNEHCSWDVYDPSTVVTIGVFDNCNLQGGEAGDLRIGKVNIHLSTLKTNQDINQSHPLLVLHPYWVKKMGEIRLVVTFRCLSLVDMICTYSRPIFPKLHYIRPLNNAQFDSLFFQSIQIVSMRLSQDEPPLRKEVVEYMLDSGSQLWSLRRSTANISRIRKFLSGLTAFLEWFDQICNWKNPKTTILVHILFSVLVIYPKLIPPSTTLYLTAITVMSYKKNPGAHVSQTETWLSSIDDAYPELYPDELNEEEFDTFPTSLPSDIVSMRYDRLRMLGMRVQTVIDELATEGERMLSLVKWRDPRATFLFAIFCLVTAIVLYLTPFELIALLTGFYVLRHPWLRSSVPSLPVIFFKRLPSRRYRLY